MKQTEDHDEYLNRSVPIKGNLLIVKIEITKTGFNTIVETITKRAIVRFDDCQSYGTALRSGLEFIVEKLAETRDIFREHSYRSLRSR